MTLKGIADIPEVVLPPTYQSNPGAFLAEMHDRHGSVLRTTSLWGDNIVFLVGPEANRLVLATHRLKFSNRQGWNLTERAVELFGSGLVFSDPPEHDEHRKLMNPWFTPARMHCYMPMLQHCIRARLDSWGAATEVDVFVEAHRITFEVAARAFLGLTEQDEIDRLSGLFFELEALDLTEPTDHTLAETRILKGIHELLKPRIDERRVEAKPDVLGSLAETKNDGCWALTDDQLIAQANTLLLAGHITTTSLTAWLVYLLASHADYRERVRQERFAVLGPSREPGLEDFDRMPLLDRALLEAERLYPPIANLPRLLLDDVAFENYLLPKGLLVFCSVAASHRLPSVFNNPEAFDPDRFGPPREEHTRTPFSLIPFGAGPRTCLGIHFATVEIKTFVSLLLARYDIELLPGCEPAQVYHPVGTPRNGVQLRLRKLE